MYPIILQHHFELLFQFQETRNLADRTLVQTETFSHVAHSPMSAATFS